MRRKLYTFFMFGPSGDANALFIKLCEEAPYTEKFFIIETDRTFQNSPKPINLSQILNEERFRQFQSKIIFEFIPASELGFQEVTNETEGWANVVKQTGHLYTKYKHLIQSQDLIFSSDCDEVLSGQDLPFIISCFEKNGSLKQCMIPMLHALYDFDNIADQRGYWHNIIVTKEYVENHLAGDLGQVRRNLNWANIPTLWKYGFPQRLSGSAKHKLLYALSAIIRTFCRLLYLPTPEPFASLSPYKVSPTNATYFGWHFSYCYDDPIDIFRKLHAIQHTEHSDFALIPEQLGILRQNRGISGPGKPLKPQCQPWQINSRLFPEVLAQNPEKYLTHFCEKIQVLSSEKILQELQTRLW